jgi:hypothetical protein
MVGGDGVRRRRGDMRPLTSSDTSAHHVVADAGGTGSGIATMRYVVAFLVAAALAACDIFTGPETPACVWRYTKFEMRTDTVWNQAGTGYVIVTHDMPTDSVRECRVRDSA